MLASKIVDAVMANTNSPDHDTVAVVLDIINRGLFEISGGGERQHGNAELAPLPSLLTSDTVTLTAGNVSVALPSDYQRSVLRVELSGKKINRYDSVNKLLDECSSGGAIAGYCVKGNSLWLSPSQSSDNDLSVYYHKFPEQLQIVESAAGPPEVLAIDSVPDCIPEHLQFRLLFHYASKEIFGEIEQGLEGALPDTAKHDAMYQKALTDLERIIGAEEGDAVNIGDESYTDDMVMI